MPLLVLKVPTKYIFKKNSTTMSRSRNFDPVAYTLAILYFIMIMSIKQILMGWKRGTLMESDR